VKWVPPFTFNADTTSGTSHSGIIKYKFSMSYSGSIVIRSAQSFMISRRSLSVLAKSLVALTRIL
jgi:hypothetical protein